MREDSYYRENVNMFGGLSASASCQNEVKLIVTDYWITPGHSNAGGHM